jgi:phosphoglycerate dehydrogenase-like enzyme
MGAHLTDGEALTRRRVLVTWIDYDVDGPEVGGRLREAGLEISLSPKHGGRSPADVAELLGDAVAAIVSTDPFDRSVFDAAPNLRVIARVGVGTDSIDLAAATDAGVLVTTTPGANQETAADHALAMILAAVRRVVEHDASIRNGEWRRAGSMTPWDLHGTTVGIVGYGGIGKAVVARLSGFKTEVLIADPALDPTAGDIEPVPLEELLQRADLVSLHLPLHDSTRGIIGRSELALMRSDAILVNTSRGGLVDEEALVDALASGSIRAAALDVFADEPYVPERLRALANVVLTPHVGGLSERSIKLMTRQATNCVVNALAGRLEAGAIVNPRALDHPRHRGHDGAALAPPR